MAREKTFTDARLEKALIEANGQPTKAAEILGVKYLTVWRRIKDNPELQEIKKAQRGKTFNDLYNLSTILALAGIMKVPVTDKETGEVIPGQFKNIAVDVRTRQNMIGQLLNLFKADEGIKNEIVVETKNTVDTSKLSDSTLDEIIAALTENEK